MGFVIFLLIVAGIIVLIVSVKKNKRKKALVEIKECKGYALALAIKDELEKKGFTFHEDNPSYDYSNGYARGCVCGNHNDSKTTIWIWFYLCRADANWQRIYIAGTKSFYSRQPWKRYFGIENPNVSILVCSCRDVDGPDPVKTDYQEIPEHITIAANVIENKGFGKCNLIE